MKEMLTIALLMVVSWYGGYFTALERNNSVLYTGLAGPQTPSPQLSELSQAALNDDDIIDGIIDVLIQIESGGDPCAIGDGGKAVGVLQLWPIAVRDVNRILGYDRYTLADRFSPAKSREMCHIVTEHYCLRKFQESVARRWVGGTHNQNTPDADRYWERALEQLKRKVKRYGK